jgi:hypothetical protein
MTTNYLFGSPLGPIPRPERAQWVAALETRQHNWRTFRKVFAEYDLLLSPTSQLLAAKVEDWAERWAGKGPVLFPHQMFAPHYTSHTHMFNWLGFPAINVPAGFIDGLPIGLQIVGPPRSEAKIFRVAHAFLKSIPEARTPKGLVNSQGAWVMPRLDGVAAPVQLRRLVEPAREQQRTIAREQMAEAWRIGTWAR